MLVPLSTRANVPSLPYPFAQFAWVSRALNILARVGTCAGTSFVQCFAWSARAMYHLPGLVLALVRPLRSSLGYHGQCTYSPVLVPRAGTSFVQCFAWSAKRGQMCLVCPTPCAVRLSITGAEHTRSCWYLCWYLFQRGQMGLVCLTPCAVRLGITGAEHTRSCWYLCWYLFRTVLRLVIPGNVSLARARTRTDTPRAVLRSVSMGNVPTCPCSCLCCV